MKILLLCNKSPYPAFEGGPMAMNSIVTGLLEAGHKVKILAVNSKKFHVQDEDIPEAYRAKTCIELIDVDLKVRPLKAFGNLFTSKSYHVERFISKEFNNRLIQVLKADLYDVVQLETLYMTPYVETIRKYHDRLAAVHFKDYFLKDESIGLDRWPERLRFCELGGGNAGMDFAPIVRELRDHNYNKWILIEHDTHLREPEIDLKKSTDILKDLFGIRQEVK